MKTLKEYYGMVKTTTCRWCGDSLSTKVDYYEHSGGYDVVGFAKRQWLSVKCQECGYDWSLWKLGVGETVADVLMKEMKKYKVYGTSHYFKNGRQHRAIVATKTKKKAAELLEQTMYSFYSYTAQTGNDKEIATAMKKLETVVIMESY